MLLLSFAMAYVVKVRKTFFIDDKTGKGEGVLSSPMITICNVLIMNKCDMETPHATRICNFHKITLFDNKSISNMNIFQFRFVLSDICKRVFL